MVGGAVEEIDQLVCENKTMLDIFYNTDMGKRKKKMEQVNVEEQPPVPIGKVCWVCKGAYFDNAGTSICQ